MMYFQTNKRGLSMMRFGIKRQKKHGLTTMERPIKAISLITIITSNSTILNIINLGQRTLIIEDRALKIPFVKEEMPVIITGNNGAPTTFMTSSIKNTKENFTNNKKTTSDNKERHTNVPESKQANKGRARTLL
jgi:hypothetical protein